MMTDARLGLREGVVQRPLLPMLRRVKMTEDLAVVIAGFEKPDSHTAPIR
jgi:hypothetical protein